jgi:deazaflavin-dependent oxidoreductase (nitroreductase family)
MPPDPNEWNRKVIEEFRANEGRVGPPFQDSTLLLLHTTGAKSGEPRLTPLVYRPEGDNLVLVASNGGAPTSPAWYYNLQANPLAQVEVGTQTMAVTARVADDDERQKLWSAITADAPQFAEYERKTTRQIPVVVLEPA